MADITEAKKLSGFKGFINPEQSEPIFNEAARQSVIMQLGQQVPLGYSGKAIPIVTGKPVAKWTNEAEQKGTTEAKLGLIEMQPKKLAAIGVVSAEVVRANPGGYSETFQKLLAEAFARAFDYAAAFGKGGDGTGSGPFEHHLAETTKSVTLGNDLYSDLTSGMSLLLTAGKKARGFAFDATMEIDFLNARDGDQRPLFANPAYVEGAESLQYGRLLGRNSFLQEDFKMDKTVGFVGDWSKAAWGVVGTGINFDISTETAVTINGKLTSLWEHNLVAIRAEAEYGFVVEDVENFAKFVRA